MPVGTTPLFTMTLRRDADHSVTVRNGPKGNLAIAAVAEGGTFEGERLRGTLVAGTSGDWATLRPDGSFLVDARLTLLTDDNVPIFMTYRGVGAFDGDGKAWMQTAPLFETGEGPYDWLNMVQAVAFGQHDGVDLVYDVHTLDR